MLGACSSRTDLLPARAVSPNVVGDTDTSDAQRQSQPHTRIIGQPVPIPTGVDQGEQKVARTYPISEDSGFIGDPAQSSL